MKIIRAYCITFMTIIILGSILYSSSVLSHPKKLKFSSITFDSQVFQASITSIFQDSQGFLWFGTRDGLRRYDGYKLTTFTHDSHDIYSISDSYVNVIYEDNSGAIWVGTGRGLNRFNPDTQKFKRYLHDPSDASSLSHNYVRGIIEDSSGTLWIATFLGLNKFIPEIGHFIHYQHDPNDPNSLSQNDVTLIYEDRSGALWLGTNHGLNMFDKETEQFKHYYYDENDPYSLSHNYIRAVYEDKSGRFWVGTYGGLNLFDRDTDQFEHYTHDPNDPNSISDNYVTTIYEDQSGDFWVGTFGDGLNLFNRDNGEFQHYQHDINNPSSLNDNNIKAIYEDATGVLWFGTFAGPNKLVKQKEQFIHYQHINNDPSSLNGNYVEAVYEDTSGVLWVAIQNGGLSKFDINTRHFKHFIHDNNDPNSLAHNTIHSINEDSEGNLWLGTYGGGIDQLDPTTEQFKHYNSYVADSSHHSSNRIMTMCEDNSNGLWVGFPIEGVARIDKNTGKSQHFPTEGTIRCIYMDKSETIWIGQSRGGLIRYDRENNRFILFKHNPKDPNSISSDGVQSIYEDRSGNLWLGTKGGLNKFDAKRDKFHNYTVKDGLPNNVIHAIVEDNDNKLWLSTNQGISKFNPTTEKFRNYDINDGLLGDKFNKGASFINSNGFIYFGGVNGLTVFHPDSIKDDISVPPIIITNFQLFNESVPILNSGKSEGLFTLPKHISELDELILSYKDNVFSFEFSALHYVAPEKNKYAYMMEGFDEGWTYTNSSKRFATYTNLDPGKYTFKVKGSNKDGVWNEVGSSIKVTIIPPLWQTWWFRLLFGLSISGIIAYIFHLRTMGIKKRNKKLREEIEMRKKIEKEREKLLTMTEHQNIELKERNDEIEKRNVVIEKKNIEMERFNYTISHDLKSPLITIKGFTGLMEKDINSANPKSLLADLKRVNEAADSMDHLLNELLTLSRLGHVVGAMVDSDMSEVIKEVKSSLHGILQNVTIEVQENLSTIKCDRYRIKEVVQNLLENSVKFMGDQKTQKIEIGEEQEEGNFVFYIRDNGVGMQPEYHEKIFDIFERLDSSVSGTGVGLALCKRIIEAHGGKIWVSSEGLGLGSTFHFQLPKHEDDKDSLSNSFMLTSSSQKVTS